MITTTDDGEKPGVNTTSTMEEEYPTSEVEQQECTEDDQVAGTIYKQTSSVRVHAIPKHCHYRAMSIPCPNPQEEDHDITKHCDWQPGNAAILQSGAQGNHRAR
jgi:hypothetical protein